MTITRVHRPRSIMVKGSERITNEGDKNGMVIYGSMQLDENGKNQRERMTKVKDSERTSFNEILTSLLCPENK